MNAMEMIVIFFAILLGAVITLILVSAYKNKLKSYSETVTERPTASRHGQSEKKTSSKQKREYLPYHKVNLLTNHEYDFYHKLKPVADKYGLQILAKIRLADLVAVNDKVNQDYFDMWFGKIMAKHIDFAIADDMKVIVLIELDDSTHSQPDRAERDDFVNKVLGKCGYDIIHTYGEMKQIESKLKKYRQSAVNAV